MADIEYFYSAHSSFAYLGSRRFMDIAHAAGRRIDHRPIDLNALLAAIGSASFRERSAAHRGYFFKREIMRWSEQRNAPVMGRPQHHHNDITLANCMLLAGLDGGQNIDALAHAMLEAHWRYDADLADTASLQRIGNEAGYDADTLLANATSPAINARYEANTREAIDRAMFGSPTYVVDGDVFYGQDRLEMVERALVQPYLRQWSGA